MSSVENQINTTPADEDDAFLSARRLVMATLMPLVMQTAIELDVFEIIAKAGEGARLSPKQIVSHLPTQNPEAPIMIDRMLRFLASHSVLACSRLTHEDGCVERVYGLTPTSKYFTANEDRVSLASVCLLGNILFNNRVDPQTNFRNRLKDVILNGGDAFQRAHGMPYYDYMSKNTTLLELFNKAMFGNTCIIMKKVLGEYKGFKNLNEVIDVGGGAGAASNMIVAKYPKIKCVNFDLPHVVANLPSYSGVMHIGGDMLSSIPNTENIFIKNALHNMSDEQCLKILKNCYKAIPDHGKVIVLEILDMEEAGIDNKSKVTAAVDINMMMFFSGAKQRTFQDFKNIAKGAGFVRYEIVCSFWNYGVMEFQRR